MRNRHRYYHTTVISPLFAGVSNDSVRPTTLFPATFPSTTPQRFFFYDPSFLPSSLPPLCDDCSSMRRNTHAPIYTIDSTKNPLSLSLELSISVLYLLLFITDSLWKFKVYCRLLRREKGMNACLYEIVIMGGWLCISPNENEATIFLFVTNRSREIHSL